MNPAIWGIGWVTAAGPGCGRRDASFSMPARPLSPPAREAVFPTPFKNYGRMDPYTKLGVASVGLALRDAGLEEWRHPRDIAVIASSEYGCLQTDLDYFETVIPHDGTQASPNLFTYTLPSSFLGEAAIRFGLTGASFVVTDPQDTGLSALREALDLMTIGQLDTVVCGKCELGRPIRLTATPVITPGAVFLVLGHPRLSNRQPYGILSSDTAGTLTLNGAKVTDIGQLVQRALNFLGRAQATP